MLARIIPYATSAPRRGEATILEQWLAYGVAFAVVTLLVTLLVT